MADYYKILEIKPDASQLQIRAAYKRLAMLYHPDRNPDNRQSEELFKEINEAYQVLSDPLKKSKYDAKVFSYYTAAESTDAYWREIKKQRAGRRHNRYHEQAYQYFSGKKYVKNQALAFLAFIVISGFCFSIIHTIQFFVEKKQAEHWQANNQFLKRIDTLFLQEKYQEAFSLVDTLSRKDPLEFRFYFHRDSLVGALRNLANGEFKTQKYDAAMTHYKLLVSYETPTRFETLYHVASCEYHLGHYKEALQILKHLHNQQPHNLDLIYQIAAINFERLHNNQEALHYASLGKRLFKRNLTEVYGKAFEVVMDVADAPDIYYDLFELRARINIDSKNYAEAITDCNWAIYLRPNNGKPFHLRALAGIRIKDFDRICTDLDNAKRLGVPQSQALQQKYCR